jgi:hypothetical protein
MQLIIHAASWSKIRDAMRESADLRYVHATGGLEPVVADRDGLVLQQAHELVLLDALLPDPPQDGEPLLQGQRRDGSCGSIRGGAGGCLGSWRGVHGGGGRGARSVSALVGDDGPAVQAVGYRLLWAGTL